MEIAFPRTSTFYVTWRPEANYVFCEIAAHTLANSYAHIVQLEGSIVSTAGKDHVLNNYIRRGNTKHPAEVALLSYAAMMTWRLCVRALSTALLLLQGNTTLYNLSRECI